LHLIGDVDGFFDLSHLFIRFTGSQRLAQDDTVAGNGYAWFYGY
jgi:hypothetical protein